MFSVHITKVQYVKHGSSTICYFGIHTHTVLEYRAKIPCWILGGEHNILNGFIAVYLRRGDFKCFLCWDELKSHGYKIGSALFRSQNCTLRCTENC